MLYEERYVYLDPRFWYHTRASDVQVQIHYSLIHICRTIYIFHILQLERIDQNLLKMSKSMNRKRMENEWSIFSELKFNFFQVMSQNIIEVLNREFTMRLNLLVCNLILRLWYFYSFITYKPSNIYYHYII